MAGETVSFSANGSGTLEPSSGVTDARGQASATYTTAATEDGSTVTVTAEVDGTSLSGATTITVSGPDISGDFTDAKFKKAIWEWLGNPVGSTPGSFTWQDLYDKMQATPGRSLDITNMGIGSLNGFEHFQGTGIVSLYCPNNQLTGLPELPESQTLWTQNDQLTQLPELPDSLQHLYCYNNQLASLPALPTGLRTLRCDGNRLTSLPALPTNLQSLQCDKNYLNVFEGPLKTALDGCGATTKIVIPQYRYSYPEETIELDAGQSRSLTASEIERQQSNDGSVWSIVGEANFADFSFSSTAATVAEINAAGVITAKNAGTCTIYADYLGINADFTRVAIPVTVNAGEPSSPPELEGAATDVDGSVVTLAFDKAMADPTGKHDQFSATVDDIPRAFSAAALRAGDTTKIELVLDGAPIKCGQEVWVSYTPGTVTAADGGVLGSFTVQLTNNALFAGGKGTAEFPYLIETAENLNNVRLRLDAHYKLVNDIDLSAYLSEEGDGYNNGAGWQPIGQRPAVASFTGTFNGNNKTISGLFIDLPATEGQVGLFGCARVGAIIQNVGLVAVNVTGQEDAGGLVGINWGGTIENSYAAGTVSGGCYVGGLVGSNRGEITNSYFIGSVSGTPTDDEGIIGGLVGEHDGSYYGGTINDSYYDKQTTGQEYGVGSGDDSGVTGMTTALMKQQATFNTAVWDFDSIWGITNGVTYPYLQWQTSHFDFAPLVFTDGYPKAGDITFAAADLQVQTDENATAYYVVLERGADRPAAAEIKAGTGKDGADPVVAGTIEDLTAGTSKTVTIA